MGRIIYLLDTNILSEPAKKNPDVNVMQRFEEYNGQFATSAIVWHELNYGCASLPDSKRKLALQSYLSTLVNNGLLILSYDYSAAEWFAQQRAALGDFLRKIYQAGWSFCPAAGGSKKVA